MADEPRAHRSSQGGAHRKGNHRAPRAARTPQQPNRRGTKATPPPPERKVSKLPPPKSAQSRSTQRHSAQWSESAKTPAPRKQAPRQQRPRQQTQRTQTQRTQARGTQIQRNQNQRPRTKAGLFSGCGMLLVVGVLLLIIALVGFIISSMASQDQAAQDRVQVPDNVPPAAAPAAPNINIHGAGRTSLQLLQWAQPISDSTGIPVQALIAYGNAEVIARESRPQCGITWNTLAGLGYVETVHGTYDGVKYGASKLDDNGFAVPPIIGPQLNGKEFANVGDTDKGALDGDPKFDRAMGPLQFIPESWGRYGVDANGDGQTSPQNIDDAAASAVRLLCDFERDLKSPDGWTRAIRSYNLSDEYVLKVRDAAANYALNQRPDA